MALLDNWTEGAHSFGGVTHPTYRKEEGVQQVLEFFDEKLHEV